MRWTAQLLLGGWWSDGRIVQEPKSGEAILGIGGEVVRCLLERDSEKGEKAN